MSRVLLAYASKHGATAEIAEAVADELREGGHAVDCVPVDQAPNLEAYDAAVIGSAVYMKRWRPEARHLLKRNRKVLAERPFWVFAPAPSGRSPTRSGPSRPVSSNWLSTWASAITSCSAAACRQSRATSWSGRW